MIKIALVCLFKKRIDLVNECRIFWIDRALNQEEPPVFRTILIPGLSPIAVLPLH